MTSLNPYKNGANRGATLGVILSVMFFCSIYSDTIPFLSLLAFAIMAGVPFLIYRWLRKTYVANSGIPTLSMLWMQGIVTFACGSLILALVSASFLRFVKPDLIMETVHKVIDLYSSLPDNQSHQVAQLLSQMVKAHAVPSAVSISLEMVWLGIFSGSLLSLLISLIVRSRPLPSNSNR